MDNVKTEALASAIPYISFGSIEELSFSSNQIIWSPNGTGKTSIVKALSSLGTLPFSFADLEASRSDFIKSGKQLVISLGIRRIGQLNAENNSILNGSDIKKRLKAAGLNKQADAKSFLPEYPRCTTDTVETFLAFQRNSALRIAGLLQFSDLKFYMTHRNELGDLSNLKSEIENLKALFVNRALESLSQAVDSETHVCPVCGGASNRTILEIIEEKIRSYEEKEGSLVSDYSKEHPSLSVIEIEEALSKLSEIKATDTELLSYCLGQGDRSKFDSLSKQKTQYKENVSLIESLSKESERFYSNLKARERELRDLFESRFEITSLAFDDEEKQLIVDLPRSVETYSTGEINLMITLVRINEFLASDNEVMVFDDPLSSLDRANQYLVMFELIRAGKNPAFPEKSITIFTHNMDCITIAESQYSHSYNYFCMEKLDGKLTLNPIESEFFEKVRDAFKNPDIKQQGARPGSLCAESLLLYRKQCPSPDVDDLIPYLDLVIERDMTNDPNAHEVFHYRGTFSHPALGLTNDRLVEYIDRFNADSLSMSSFADRTIQKIFVFLALRVWVEKQIFDLYPELFANTDDYPQLGELIKKAFELGAWRGSGSVTKEFLNSKKTMLNHNAHSKAQTSPFDFAINLSVSDICSEVAEIKRRFEQ